MSEEQKMQYMANGIILTCSLLISNDFCINTKEAISNIFEESNIVKEEFESCEDDVAKDYIIHIFGGKEKFFKEVGWSK